MTIKFTKNFAGIIDALKFKSGSKKFYKPNYEGVIQAILDMWGGGGIEIIYPPAGFPPTGNDGDMIGYPDDDGNWFIWIWADGEWQKTKVYTTDVIPNPPGGVFPKKDVTTPDGEVLTDQRDINWYLYNLALNRVCVEKELENVDTLPITEEQYVVVYDSVADITSIYLHPDVWEDAFNEDSEAIYIDGEAYEIVEVITADGAMIVVNVKGAVTATAGEITEFSSCEPIGGGPQMVFYGEKPPEKAPDGALFTQEDSLKQFVHQPDGEWVDLSNCGGSGVQMVYWGIQPPDTAPEGALFTQEDSNKQFIHQGDGVWVEQSSCGTGGDVDLQPIWDVIDPYVKYVPASITGENTRIYVTGGTTYAISAIASTNNIGSTEQRAEVDEQGDGNWVPISKISNTQLNTYSLSKGGTSGYDYLVGAPTIHGGNPSDPSTWENPNFPNLKVRYWTENIVSSKRVKVYTEEDGISPYYENHKKITDTNLQ